MKYFCISNDPDVLTGMRLAGIPGVHATTPREVSAAVDRAAADSDVAVLLVTESCYLLQKERLNELKLSAERPLVNIIADSHGPRGAIDSITDLISEAIGIKI